MFLKSYKSSITGLAITFLLCSSMHAMQGSNSDQKTASWRKPLIAIGCVTAAVAVGAYVWFSSDEDYVGNAQRDVAQLKAKRAQVTTTIEEGCEEVETGVKSNRARLGGIRKAMKASYQNQSEELGDIQSALEDQGAVFVEMHKETSRRNKQLDGIAASQKGSIDKLSQMAKQSSAQHNNDNSPQTKTK